MATTVTSANVSTAANNKNPIQELARLTDNLVKDRINSAPYNQTYIGTIIAVKFNGETDVKSADYNKYTVRFNTLERDFIINDGKFHIVGEKVYVHIPNNDLSKRYVETIQSYENLSEINISKINNEKTILTFKNKDLYEKYTINKIQKTIIVNDTTVNIYIPDTIITSMGKEVKVTYDE